MRRLTMANGTGRPASRNYLAIRYGLLGGVLFMTALVVYGLIRYPSAFTISPVESVIYLALFVGSAVGYSWFALRHTQGASGLALYWGGWLGLALGLCWLIELWAGDLADPSTSAVAMVAYRVSTLAVPVLTVVAAAVVSRQTRQ